jgi:LacI family transcriptional regulator
MKRRTTYMTNKRATLRKVADIAGVSTAAVSRFLGGTLDLPEETAQRVRAAIRETRYVPHDGARRLRVGRSETLGFVTTDLSNPFFALLASAVASSAWDAGFDLLVWNSEDIVEREVTSVRRLRSSYIDGLLMVTHHKSDKVLLSALRDVGPMVFLDEDVPGIQGSRVFVDNRHGGWLATKTLIQMGHERIAHVGSPADLMSAELRCAGWRQALAEANLSVPESYYVHGKISQSFGRAALEQLMQLSTPPTAIFVGADEIAFGIIAASHQSEIAIPRDLSLIAFDGLPIGELLDPPLTTVAQPIKEMGQKGVELLIRQLENPSIMADRIVLPVTLNMRASAAPLIRGKATRY